MAGYRSKRMLSESRDPDFGYDLTVPDLDYHYRETSDMIMEKANADLFYNLRHLKMFKERTKMEKSRWFITWDDGDRIIIHDERKQVICDLDDILMAEYICSLHNMSFMLIKEVEDKYAEC
jgi:hypothetical protein